MFSAFKPSQRTAPSNGHPAMSSTHLHRSAAAESVSQCGADSAERPQIGAVTHIDFCEAYPHNYAVTSSTRVRQLLCCSCSFCS